MLWGAFLCGGALLAASCEAGGWPSSSKGSDAYAHYSDMACVWFYLHINHKEEKQQPPLGQVTVV